MKLQQKGSTGEWSNILRSAVAQRYCPDTISGRFPQQLVSSGRMTSFRKIVIRSTALRK